MADNGSYAKVGGWSLYRNQTNCSAYLMFDNDEAVGFNYDARNRSTRVTFTDARATSLKAGNGPVLDILLRRADGTVDHSWESTPFVVTVAEDGRRTLSSRWLPPPALESFRTAAYVGFFDKQRQIGVFSLKGTSAALQEVKNCSMRVHNIEP
jgi:YD repeat-containing protein